MAHRQAINPAAKGADPETILWFLSFGLRLAIQSDTPGALARLASRTPMAWKSVQPGRADRLYSITSAADTACHVVSVGPVAIGRAATLDLALDALEIDARHFVAQFARRRVFVHAATAAVNGRAVVTPGRSGTGKSTLVAAMARAGAEYYSDEYAVFDNRGRVHAYPKHLTLWGEDDSKAAEDLYPTDMEKLRPIRLGAILSGPFAGLGTIWQPSIASAGRGMMELLDNTVAVRRQPEQSLVFLQRALNDVLVFVSPRGGADQTAKAVMACLRSGW